MGPPANRRFFGGPMVGLNFVLAGVGMTAINHRKSEVKDMKGKLEDGGGGKTSSVRFCTIE